MELLTDKKNGFTRLTLKKNVSIIDLSVCKAPCLSDWVSFLNSLNQSNVLVLGRLLKFMFV